MAGSNRQSPVLLAHVTQPATPQRATHPSALGQLPFMTTTQEATPLPCSSEQTWVQRGEVTSLRSQSQDRRPCVRATKQEGHSFLPHPKEAKAN